jgi:hypothetical protein
LRALRLCVEHGDLIQFFRPYFVSYETHCRLALASRSAARFPHEIQIRGVALPAALGV